MSRAQLIAIGIACTWSVGANAQSAAAFRDSAIRISAEVDRLRDSLFERDSTVTEVTRHGSLVLSASVQQRTRASKAFEEFLARKARWFGTAVPSPDGFRIVVQVIPAVDIFGRFGREHPRNDQVVLGGLPDTGGAIRRERSATPDNLSSVFLESYTELMFLGLSGGMRNWLVDPPPFQMDEHERRYLAMYSAMTSTGRAGRGCLAGRVDYCAFALGLRPAPSSDLTDAYPPVARNDFFLSVLGTGGPDAWARLAGDQRFRAEDALAAAGQAPIDSLISAWRGSLVGLRPEESPLEPRGMLLAAGWAAGLLLGTLAATRWR